MIDARERFFRDYVAAGAARERGYQGVYPLSAALSRPLIGALLVETAQRYGADTVAHGCTGKGNDQVRIELAVRALSPDLTVRAPLRERPLSRPGRDRVCARARHSGRALAGEAVFDRCEFVGAFDRGRRAGRSVERAAGRCVRLDARPDEREAQTIVVQFERGYRFGAGCAAWSWSRT